MFLSPKAKSLLDSNKISELQALPFNELIANYSTIFERDALSRPTSAPIGAQDAVLLETLEDPVVVSSGHIYSRQTVVELMKNSPARCPNTREILRSDCIIPVPQVAKAIDFWKQENISMIDPGMFTFTMKVSANKFRLYFTGDEKLFNLYLQQVFWGKQNHITSCQSGYYANNWSFAWMAANKNTQLELWFPEKALQDSDVLAVIEALLKAVRLPLIDDVDSLPTVSMKNLSQRSYVTVMQDVPVGYQQAKSCLMAFIQAGAAIRQRLAPGIKFEDKVMAGDVDPAFKKQELGLGLFAPALSAAVVSSSVAAAPSSVVLSSSPWTPAVISSTLCTIPSSRTRIDSRVSSRRY